MNVLHVCANPLPTEEAVAKHLAAKFFTTLVGMSPDVEMVNVDLYTDQPPFYSYEEYRNFWYPALIEGYTPTKDEQTSASYAVQQGRMFNEADALVITTTVFNFGVPAVLKSWLEHVLNPGNGFYFQEGNIKPAHKIKKLVLLVDSLEAFKEADPRDTLTQQIFAAFNEVGIDDIGVAWADGQNTVLYRDFENRKEMALEAAEELAEEVAEIGATA